MGCPGRGWVGWVHASQATEPAMPNVAELIREHVVLTVECIDRVYLNAYVPRLQSEGGVIGFLRRRSGRPIPSPALFGQITRTFKEELRAWCRDRDIPWLEFKKGERKDDVVEPYRRCFINRTGVVLVGVAQERANGWRGIKRVEGGRVHFDYRRTSVYVAHYYVYFVDEDWGPGFLKICGYAPYTLKLCLNGHEWAKRQLTRAGIAFTALDNGFERCADPAALQAICDRLGADDVRACLDRWLRALPLPLTRADAAGGSCSRRSSASTSTSAARTGSSCCSTARSSRRPRAGARPGSSLAACSRACASSTSAATSSSTSRRGAPCAPRPPSTTPTTSGSPVAR